MEITEETLLSEFNAAVTKYSLPMCCVTVIPLFDLEWKAVAQGIRDMKLPMSSASVAKILCRYASKNFEIEKIANIVSLLKLKLASIQNKTWHLIKLSDPFRDESIADTKRGLPRRISRVIRNSGGFRAREPVIQSVIIEEFLHISVHMPSTRTAGSTLYLATPLGESVALVTSLHSHALIKACCDGLGYRRYENAHLQGTDISSLLRIYNGIDNVHLLSGLPEYDPQPVVTPSGIDFTTRKYNEDYIDTLLGPNPPMINRLNITTKKPFYDASFTNAFINYSVTMKSNNIAKTLKNLVSVGALAPVSKIVEAFVNLKSNTIEDEMF